MGKIILKSVIMVKSYLTFIFVITISTLLFAQNANRIGIDAHVRYASDTLFTDLPAEIDVFNIGLDPVRLFSTQPKAIEDVTTYYLPDTMLVYSVSANPKRYTYSYDNNAANTITLIKKLENEEWVNVSFISKTFDDFGNTLTNITKAWQNSTWVNVSKTTSTYVGNHLLKTRLLQIWDGTNWQNTDSITYTYNTNGNLVASLSEIWFDNDWLMKYSDIYLRDDEERIYDYTRQEFDGTNWVNQLKRILSYDADGLLDSVINELWQSNLWIPLDKETYTYNSLDQQTGTLFQNWEGSDWTNVLRFTYAYNSEGFVESGITEKWENGSWVNFTKGNYTQNGFGSIQSTIIENWENDSWENVSLTNYDFDANGNALEGSFYFWTGDTWAQNADGILEMRYNLGVYNQTFTAYQVEASYFSMLVDLPEKIENKLLIYPNPATDHFVISFDKDIDRESRVIIYDLTGRVIQTLNLSIGSQNKEISLEGFPDGIYFVQFANQFEKTTKKLIINH